MENKPVNPFGAKSLIAKGFVKETWWIMALGGTDSAQLKALGSPTKQTSCFNSG